MGRFRCDKCGKLSEVGEVRRSIEKYGFVSLVGDDDELIAFNCPSEQCHSNVYMQLPLNGGARFYNNFLNPMGFNDYYCQLTSPPFSQASYNILRSFEVLDYSQSAWEIKEGVASQLWGAPAICFSSCNPDIPSFFSNDIREYIYKSTDIERLLERESRDKIRLFPRYVRNSQLFKNLDRFFLYCFSSNISIIQSFSDDGVSSNSIVSPAIFWDLLSLPPKLPDPVFEWERYALIREQQLQQHNKIIEELSPLFIKGLLSGRLLTLAKEFADDYAEEFDHYRLSDDKVWEFKEKYLEKLYCEWTFGDLPRDNNPKRKNVNTIVKEQCQIFAEKMFEDDPTLSAKDIASCNDIQRIAQRSYREPGREETKTYSYRKILEWVKEALPEHTHPKPGRPAGKPRPR